MEKSVPERLVDAGLAQLAELGAGGATVRAVESRAGVPHGSVRHHFGNLEGLRAGLVTGLLAVEMPVAETPEQAVARWLGPGRPIAQARYELILLAAREPSLRPAMLAARQQFVTQLAAVGVGLDAAESLVAMLDGLVLDALLRGRSNVDLTCWEAAVEAAKDRAAG
jgi:Bacterial regulatory proteins, tetR family.